MNQVRYADDDSAEIDAELEAELAAELEAELAAEPDHSPAPMDPAVVSIELREWFGKLHEFVGVRTPAAGEPVDGDGEQARSHVSPFVKQEEDFALAASFRALARIADAILPGGGRDALDFDSFLRGIHGED